MYWLSCTGIQPGGFSCQRHLHYPNIQDLDAANSVWSYFWTNDCKKLLAWTGLMNNTRLLWSCSIILAPELSRFTDNDKRCLLCGLCDYMMSNIRKKHHYCQWSCPFFQSTVIWFLFHGKNEQLFSDLCLCLIKFTHWHLDPDIIKRNIER